MLTVTLASMRQWRWPFYKNKKNDKNRNSSTIICTTKFYTNINVMRDSMKMTLWGIRFISCKILCITHTFKRTSTGPRRATLETGLVLNSVFNECYHIILFFRTILFIVKWLKPCFGSISVCIINCEFLFVHSDLEQRNRTLHGKSISSLKI